MFILLLYLLFLICIAIGIQYKKSKEWFVSLTDEETQLLVDSFNPNKNNEYIKILSKFKIDESPLDKKNYCDARSLIGKKCDINLIYTNK